jgi:putative ABC transport system ATP-binding protein
MIRVAAATKVHGAGEAGVRALDGVTFEVERGRFALVTGPSGSGKSTLLHLLGALDAPTSGEVWIDGEALHRLDDAGRTRVRRERLGFVFQFFNLLPTLTALENVCLPGLLARRPRGPVEARARALLERFGLGARLGHAPGQLSGGEMQRVALARALVLDPPVVLADEPTGNLDSRSAEVIVELLRAAAHELGRTVVMVTHDPRAERHADRVLRLVDGRLEGLAAPGPGAPGSGAPA